MNSQTIRSLAKLIPIGSRFYDGASTSQDILADALSDPKFGWHFVMSLIEAEKDFPCSVYEPSFLRRAYQYKRNDIRDDVVGEAVALDHPKQWRQAAVLKALLLCGDLSLQKIATITGLPVEVVSGFETLFFNVQDRLNDKSYVATLAFPEGRLAYADPGIQAQITFTTQLLQAALGHGHAEVLFLAGITEDSLLPNDLSKELEDLTLRNAIVLARHGHLNATKSPGIQHAKGIVMAKLKSRTDVAPDETIGAVALGESILASLMQAAQPAIRGQLEARRKLNEAHQGTKLLPAKS